MDFSDSKTEAEYRTRARLWLAANAPVARRGGFDGEETADDVQAVKAWQARKADAGYACIAWPAAWGGPGGTAAENIIFHEEEARFGVGSDLFGIGLGMCLPTIMTVGNEADKLRFVGPAMRGAEIWCQLFSEPSAGSDVAAARTRAKRSHDGSGEWIVNGQKIWTSGAHHADFGLLLARTDPDVPKHAGLTMFWIDMRAPGVEVRSIRQADGGRGFNEVFFTDLRLRDDQRVGEIGQGWPVALVTLMNERQSVGSDNWAAWSEAMEMAAGLPGIGSGQTVLQDGGFREKLADWYVVAEGLRFTRLRSQTALSRGQTPGSEASIGKLVAAGQMQEIATELLDRLGYHAMVCAEDPASPIAGFQRSFFWGAAMRIAGGTDEILKNIIAERVLGLPAEPRVDRDVAFREVPGC